MPGSSVFVDTSGWAALADRRQAEHVAMQRSYQQFVGQNRRLLTTNYVIAELVPLLDQRLHFPRPDIFRFIRAIESASFLDIIYADPNLDDEALKLLEQYTDKEWSLVDAMSFILMRQRGVTEALTTDHHFIQAGFLCLP